MNFYAWTAASAETPQPVGRLLPNQFGLFDSLGNVSEWCQSWYDDKPPETSNLVDGDEGDGSYVFREFRGGDVLSPSATVIDGARKTSDYPFNLSETLGFRVVRTVPD